MYIRVTTFKVDPARLEEVSAKIKEMGPRAKALPCMVDAYAAWRGDGQGRFRYKWGSTTVQFYLLPKGEARTSVVVTHMKLESARALEESRALWRRCAALGTPRAGCSG